MLYICAKNSDKTIRSTSVEDRFVGTLGKTVALRQGYRKEASVNGGIGTSGTRAYGRSSGNLYCLPAFVNRRDAYRFYLPPRAQYDGCRGSLQGWLDNTPAKMCTPAYGAEFIVARIYNIRASARAGNQGGTMARIMGASSFRENKIATRYSLLSVAFFF